MKYDLFITDYDGTLGDPNGIDAETVAAVKEYVSKGGKFVVCSGRTFPSIRSMCDMYEISDVIVSFQGARINERVSGKTLFKSGLKKSLVIEALKATAETDATPFIITENVIYYSQPSSFTRANANSTIIKLERVNDLLEFVKTADVDCLKVNAKCEGKTTITEFVERFSDRFKGKMIVNSGGPNLAEFINPECSKGSAVRFLAEYYSVPFEKIITVGDSTNDIELVSGKWHGVAVGSAHEQLKKYAKEITVEYKNHPVKFLLEKYCL